ncbi:MAG TPA: EAL domain-containing protein [Acidimicrobiia bacterium]|nr:EAL domain-containing protein [Acidimicrobiia bacterium]
MNEESIEQTRWGARPRLVTLACVMVGAVGAITLGASIGFSGLDFSHWEMALLLFGGATLLQIMPVRLSHEGQGESLHLEETFLLPMAIFLSYPECLLAIAGAVGIGHTWHRRGWRKTVFNTGQLVTSAGIGVGIAQLIGAGPGHPTFAAVAAAALGVLIYSVLSMVAVGGIITLAQGSRFRDAVLDGLEVRAATWISAQAMGITLAVAMDIWPGILLVAALPGAMLQITYSRSFRHYRERRQMEKLYGATAAIRSNIDVSGVRGELLRAARTLLEAGAAQLVDSGAPTRAETLRAPVDPGTSLEVTDRVGGGRWSADDEFMLRTLASVASSALANAALFEQIRTITGSLGEGVLALDREARVEFANPAATAILGWSEAELLGRRPHETLHRQSHGGRHDPSCPLVAPLALGEATRVDDDLFAHRDGSLLPVAFTSSPVIRDGELVGTVIAFHDISERKDFERRLTHQAFHDDLTGLPNRSLFLDRLGCAQARAARTVNLHALLFIDLDRFKVVNDSLGHQIGDELLIQVAERIAGCLRSTDTLARFGGDEFVALLEDLEDDDEAVDVTKRILDGLRHPFPVAGRELTVSCSIGVVIGPDAATDPDECLRLGDVAMYRAKSRGRNCFEVFRHDPAADQRGRLDLEIELRDAIERGELELHYQPIISAMTGATTGFEALVRWWHPRRGLVPPGEFIPLAEESGLILPLGAWVLEEACRQAQLWAETLPGTCDRVMSVNLSPRQFRQPDLVEQVSAVLVRTGLPADRLCVEVTEGVMVDDVEAAIQTLHRLKALGVRVAIDDFGTGYSSLSYLKRFPVDYVKIDRAFIRGLGEQTVDSEIVRSVIRLAAAIGIQAVAEGVETPEQLRQLRKLDCPLVQGFLIARPERPANLDLRFFGADPMLQEVPVALTS